MTRFLHPLLAILACSSRQELAPQIQYLKIENQILRSKLPKRITVTPSEPVQFVKAGRKLGSKIQELITIVCPRTFASWEQAGTAKRKSAQTGRPHTPEQIRELLLRIARDTGWGYARILGELKK